MGINATATKRDDGGWDFAWSVGTPPYSIYLDGELLEETSDESFTFQADGYDDEAPALEILNDGDTVESLLYPPFVRLQWRGLTSADGYKIEQYVGSAWTEVASLVPERGLGEYGWTNPNALDDAATAQFRVTAIKAGAGGSVISGTPLSFTKIITRNPPPPSISLAMSGGNLVVSAA